MDVAQGIFPDNAHLRMDRGQLLMLLGKSDEAEQVFRRSIELKSSAEAWEMLCDLLWSEQHYDEALAAIQKATEISFSPDRLYVKYGLLASRRQRPREALAAFDQAARFAARRDSSTTSGAEFYAALAEGRGHAWFLLGDLQRAIEFQEQAVHFTPRDGRRWKDLAYLYQATGRTSDAQQALQQIK